jgi:hypothetical protein
MMTFKRALVFGSFALAALTGCTTGMAPAAVDASGGDFTGQASPGLAGDGGQTCGHNGGWYDSVAGACDDNAP